MSNETPLTVSVATPRPVTPNEFTLLNAIEDLLDFIQAMQAGALTHQHVAKRTQARLLFELYKARMNTPF